MDPDSTLTSEELQDAFRTGAIFHASDADLERYLRHLGSVGVINDAVQHRATIRAHVIDTVRLFRFTQRLEDSNRRLSRLVIALTIGSVVLSLASAAASWFTITQGRVSSEQTSKLLTLQHDENEHQLRQIDLQERTIKRLEELQLIATESLLAVNRPNSKR
jgi:hypothetical protein